MTSWRHTTTADNIKAIVRAVRRVWFHVHDVIIEFFARLVRHKTLVRERLRGADPQGGSTSAAVYVHFDKEGVVFDYVIHQLEQLVAAGFRITFVSNSPKFPDESRTRLAPYCRTIIWRFNTGYDFGAYKDGIASIGDLQAIDRLILMNDSVYGPFWKLTDTLAQIDETKADYWGIVDTWEGQYHMQTFFLVFLPRALTSDIFRDFWADLPYIDNKGWVIRNAEMRLGHFLARGGLRPEVLVPFWSVAKTVRERMGQADWTPAADDERFLLNLLYINLLRGRPINPMHYFWDVIITDYRCPFIKRELIQSNPTRMPSVRQWDTIVRSVSNYDIGLIDDHQKSLRERATRGAPDKATSTATPSKPA